MRLGNLDKVLDGEQMIYEALEDNVFTNSLRKKYDNSYAKQSRLSKILTKLSQYGMNYDDQVLKNMSAIPADKSLQNKEDLMIQQSVYGSLNNWRVKSEEDRKFSEKTLEQRRETLRKLAMAPELEDILDIMANECIVYDDDEAYIGQPFIDTALVQDLTEKSTEEIRNSVNTSFYKIYMLLNWKINAWDAFKSFLIDGVLASSISIIAN